MRIWKKVLTVALAASMAVTGITGSTAGVSAASKKAAALKAYRAMMQKNKFSVDDGSGASETKKALRFGIQDMDHDGIPELMMTPWEDCGASHIYTYKKVDGKYGVWNILDSYIGKKYYYNKKKNAIAAETVTKYGTYKVVYTYSKKYLGYCQNTKVEKKYQSYRKGATELKVPYAVTSANISKYVK